MPVRQGSAAAGLTRTPRRRWTVVTAAISVSGTAKRIVQAMESTSAAVVREMDRRSARSTVESGRPSTRRQVLEARRTSAPRVRTRRAARARSTPSAREGTGRGPARACRRKPASSRPGRTARDGPAAPVTQDPLSPRGVQADHPDERPPVPAREQLGLAPKLGPVGDRKELAHRSLPTRDRLTVVGRSLSSSRCVPSATTLPPRTRTTLSA